MNGDHDRCYDGLEEGLIGGWYCGCKHTQAEDDERRDRMTAWLSKALGEQP